MLIAECLELGLSCRRRLLLARLLRARCQDGVQRVAFLPGAELHDALALDVFDQSFQDLTSEIRAGHFATAEEDGGFHLVAFFEEAQHVFLFGVVIVVVHIDAELDLFYGDRLLMLLGFALFLFLLVEILPVIHDAAYGRLRGGRNLNQVQAFLAGFPDRFVWRHNPEHIAVVVNHANFAGPNTVIDADKTFIDTVLRALSN